jgi:opacity protein-like surface antigen
MDREIRILGLAAIAAIILAPALAAAAPPVDSAQVAPKAEQTDPKACANGNATVGQGGGGVDVRGQPGSNLSDKLAQSNGVICPPAGVDPEIHEPTPPGGSMKVIPPPGTPGGNPSVQPK